MSRHIIGLTGGYCSGKNQVGKSIAARGFNVIDADLLAHEALSTCAPELARTFGEGILNPDGSVNRSALGSIVFADKAKLRLHESIVHPVIMDLLDKEIDASRKACINATLLYRYPYEVAKCDFVIEVRASLCTRIRRGRQRDGFGAADVVKRVRSQRYLWKMRPKNGPEVIFMDNNGSPEQLEKRIGLLLDRKIVLH
ncbi:MAG: dephospho-CoA kinase [Spirochaetaceae bacterium]|nr:dephospho-CoA kinase [Spirochaetaceae bacterium]